MNLHFIVRRVTRCVALERLIGVGLLAGCLLLVARPAGAVEARQRHNAAALATMSLSVTSAPAGSSVTVRGADFPPRASGALSWSGVSVAPTIIKSGAKGSFSVTVKVPQVAPGSYILVAAIGGTTAQADFRVPASTSSPTPSPTASPTPSATASPTPSPTTTPSAPACSTTLQRLVDAAAPGAVVIVPACVYRETVTITKSLTLDGQGKAEIRGSDIWTSGWVRGGSYWTHPDVPRFPAHGRCQSGTSRCQWPEQVFFDGRPLTQVASNPASGQFAVDSGRNLILADNPSGRTVEVTIRTRWIVTRTDGVTIQGFTMKHAANDYQTGAISNSEPSGGDRSNITFRDNVLSDAHGAVVSLINGSGLQVLNNEISRGGGGGIHGWQTVGTIIRGNQIHDNNTEAFDSSWEAGGVKVGAESSLAFEDNDVYANEGPGFWCDIGCDRVVVNSNRVHDNTKAGILYEISHYGKIFDNRIWRNGAASPDWGVGAGVLCDGCDHTEIYRNVVAWNTNGITVISQDRGTQPVVENSVHENWVISDRLILYATALAWNENWQGPLYLPASNNRGWLNTYWFPDAESTAIRFAWPGFLSRLADFNSTPGEDGARYLSTSEKDRVLADAAVPAR